jgi:hypothetical protein
MKAAALLFLAFAGVSHAAGPENAHQVDATGWWECDRGYVMQSRPGQAMWIIAFLIFLSFSGYSQATESPVAASTAPPPAPSATLATQDATWIDQHASAIQAISAVCSLLIAAVLA